MTKKTRAKTSGTSSRKGVAKVAASTKLDTLVALLRRPNGATIQELMTATSWQAHSVRGALAARLKKRGHSVTSEKIDGRRRYRIAEAQA